MQHIELTEHEAEALAAILSKLLLNTSRRQPVTTPAKAIRRYRDGQEHLLDVDAM